jgi:hypothetical protein
VPIQIALGIVYGCLLGFINARLLSGAVANARKHGEEPFNKIGKAFALRMLVIAVGLLLVMRWPAVAVAAATSAIGYGFIDLSVWFRGKGGVIK